MTSRLRMLALALAVAAVPLAAARGQQASQRLTRRLTIAVNVALSNSYAHADVEQALRSGGMGDVLPGGCLFGFCSGPVRHPFSTTGKPAGTWSLRYLLARQLELRAEYTGGDLGSTEGYHADSTGYLGTWLTLSQRMQTVSVQAALVGTGNIWLAAGPSLNHVRVADVSSAPERQQSSSAWAPGAVIGAGLVTSEHSRLFVEFTGQYRFVLPVTIGPISWPTVTGTFTPLPRTRAKFGYGLVALGMGVRL